MSGDQAFAALKKICHDKISSTERTRKKLYWQAAKMVLSAATMGVGALAHEGSKIAKECFTFILPKLPDLMAGAKELIPASDGPVDRSKIPSILQHGKTLAQIAPGRSGTQGFMKEEDLVKSLKEHHQMAEVAQSDIPVGVPIQILSCCHAEELYQHFVDMDYHMSKVKAYAQALQSMSKSYLDLCAHFEKDWAIHWTDMNKKVSETMGKPLEWHGVNCGSDPELQKHCYRATFTKAPPPPLQPQGPVVRRPGPPPFPPPLRRR